MATYIGHQYREKGSRKNIRGLHIDITESGSVTTNCKTTEPGDVIDILQAIIRFIMDNDLVDVLKVAGKRHLMSTITREDEDGVTFEATIDPEDLEKALSLIFGEDEEEEEDVRKSQSLPS